MVWTHDLTIPVRCSSQLSYKATDVGSWSIMCSYVPLKEMNVTDEYEMNHIRSAEMKAEEWSLQLWTQFMQLRKKPEKNSGLQWGLNLWMRSTGAMLWSTELWSHWFWELVSYVFICARERDECDRCIWNKSYKYCRNEIKWRMILAVVNAIYATA